MLNRMHLENCNKLFITARYGVVWQIINWITLIMIHYPRDRTAKLGTIELRWGRFLVAAIIWYAVTSLFRPSCTVPIKGGQINEITSIIHKKAYNYKDDVLTL